MKLLAGPARQGRLKPLLLAAVVLGIAIAVTAPEDGAGQGDAAAVVRARPVPLGIEAATGETMAGSLLLPPREAADEDGANAFARHSWYVPPPPPPPVKAGPPPKPVAPPLPFSFLGSFAATGGTPVYYLVRGDRVYDVKVGDRIDGTYSLDAAENGRLQFTYLPLNERQSLAIGN